MDLIRIGIIIDKMAVLLWGLRHFLFTLTEMSPVCSFHMKSLDSEGKRLVRCGKAK